MPAVCNVNAYVVNGLVHVFHHKILRITAYCRWIIINIFFIILSVPSVIFLTEIMFFLDDIRYITKKKTSSNNRN